jgi:Bacterial regulatory helix-turn-helix protein, lysR family
MLDEAIPSSLLIRKRVSEDRSVSWTTSLELAMSSTPDPLDLQCVVTLAETLSFTETAKRLHMTQPGITARINRVEKNHGYKRRRAW